MRRFATRTGSRDPCERSERSHRGRRHDRSARRGTDIGGELTAESLFARLSPHPLGSGVGRLRHSVERDDQSCPLGCDSMVADSTAAID